MKVNEMKNEIEKFESFKRSLNKVEQARYDVLVQRISDIERQIQLAGRVRTRSTNGKYQTRSTGERGIKNRFGHASGTIGASIDEIVTNPDLSGRYSKLEIAALCGTKTSKINSHLRNELVKKYGFDFVVNKNGKVEMIMPATK